MTTKFVQPGQVLDYTPDSNVTAGQVVLIRDRIGVALTAIAANATGPLQVSGVFNIAKLSTDVVAQGASLFWDNTNSRLTTTSDGDNTTLAGYAAAAAGNGATTVAIKINA